MVGGIVASRRVRLALAIAVVLLLGTNVVALRSVLNRARPVSIEQVLHRFRVEQQAAAAPSPQQVVVEPSQIAATTAEAAPGTVMTRHVTLAAPTSIQGLTDPTPGGYVYDTQGGEDTNAAGGVHHGYPAQTTITMTAQPCGMTMRWDALQQRFDEWGVCVNGRRVQVVTERMKHSFYGINDDRSYTCTNTAFRPGAELGGTPIGGQCQGSSDLSQWSGEVVGRETVMVGTTSVLAIHIKLHEEVSGSTSGTRDSDNWFAENSALLLKRVSKVTGDSMTSVGRVHYTENVSLVLASLSPQQ